MSENGTRVASFDHVDDRGDLVFVCDHRHFAVRVDDALDRAILEAKQVKEEEDVDPQTGKSKPLPVSAIQAAVRAGARPEQVAQQYAVNEALVRRFAAPVETEKKYAIEQFLTMPAPKGSGGRNYQELIGKVLARAGVSLTQVSWQATRRGYEPWNINGVFTLDKRIFNARWAWNMHDNTVTCLNGAARMLLDNSTDDHGQDRPAEAIDDQTDRRPPSQKDTFTQIEEEDAGSEGQESGERQAALTAWLYGKPKESQERTAEREPSHPSAELTEDSDTAEHPPIRDNESTMVLPVQNHGQGQANQEQPRQEDPGDDAGQDEQEDQPKEGRRSKRAKKHSGRSAVPSWDEILFGK
ncbi:septation protein SepH [Bifidobacterium sp. H6bp9]|uniref:septation protein SepH n=1 Tax=Bifidobacterium sp. H6bp9 TaxID=3051961 RepID=UPI0028BD345D|nr:septation protein SepH [Bifidobacterium sp. H6bp9]MDT7511515.1 septation protein SepH [Bifidobacterium sp. H6bp9]